MLRVSRRVGVARRSSTPQLADHQSVGDAEHGQRQQVGAGEDQQAVATSPHLPAAADRARRHLRTGDRQAVASTSAGL